MWLGDFLLLCKHTISNLESFMKSKRILIETILVICVAMCGMLLLPRAKTVFALFPSVYLLIERHVRKRPWADLDFRFSTFWEDLRANWLWFVLVGVIMQPLIVVLAYNFVPAYLEHVVSRLPFPQGINWFVLVPMLAFSLIAEEMTFRTLIQGRLTPYLGKAGAILLASLLFGISHFSSGVWFIVLIDIAGIFVDSILYGIIYARSNNLVVTWAAHLLGDILGMLFLISLIQGVLL
ncbi:MAG: CPBP family intramembrane metalloprotease [Anaerolineales bacterium]|nr:MAG: CPBP family intramembrane metalloprotease [Anaerolineales bacterium]